MHYTSLLSHALSLWKRPFSEPNRRNGISEIRVAREDEKAEKRPFTIWHVPRDFKPELSAPTSQKIDRSKGHSQAKIQWKVRTARGSLLVHVSEEERGKKLTWAWMD